MRKGKVSLGYVAQSINQLMPQRLAVIRERLSFQANNEEKLKERRTQNGKRATCRISVTTFMELDQRQSIKLSTEAKSVLI